METYRARPPTPHAPSASDPTELDVANRPPSFVQEAQQTASTAWLDSDQPLCQPSSENAVEQLVSAYKPRVLAPSLPDVALQDANEHPGIEPQAFTEGEATKAAHFQLALRRFAPFYEFGAYFEGDAASRGIPRQTEGGGGHTADPLATARVETIVSIDGDQIATSSHCDVSRHPWLGEDQEIPTTVDASATEDDVQGHIHVHHAGANPLTVSPAIDTKLHADYEVTPEGLHIEGVVTGNEFPNAEVFLVDNAGNTVMLSEFDAQRGSLEGPYGYLWAEGNQLLGEFEATVPLDEQGNFAMTCGPSTNERGEATP